jgi:hypothetical protein
MYRVVAKHHLVIQNFKYEFHFPEDSELERFGSFVQDHRTCGLRGWD